MNAVCNSMLNKFSAMLYKWCMFPYWNKLLEMLKGLQQDNIYLDKGCIERGAVEVKCLTKEHNTLTPPSLTSRPLD